MSLAYIVAPDFKIRNVDANHLAIRPTTYVV